jgi:anoctamin-10
MEEHELRVKMTAKQMEVDKLLKRVAKETNSHIQRGHVELLDEKTVSRDTWNAYYVYQHYLEDFLGRVDKADKHEEVRKSKGFIYKLVFLKALGDVNSVYKLLNKSMFGTPTILKTIWDRLGVPIVSPWGPYMSQGNDIWRKYEVNERGVRSEFSNMDGIKVSH